MYNRKEEERLVKIIRLLVAFFIIALILSGITAFPVETELRIMTGILGIQEGASPDNYEGLEYWLALIYEGISKTNADYPFIAYGYDWLAFAHLVIAVAFIGVYLKPVRNIWIVHFGMIACIGIIPLAFICGAVRGIPFFWTLLDCSFGIFGIIPLYFLHIYIKKLEVVSGFVPFRY